DRVALSRRERLGLVRIGGRRIAGERSGGGRRNSDGVGIARIDGVGDRFGGDRVGIVGRQIGRLSTGHLDRGGGRLFGGIVRRCCGFVGVAAIAVGIRRRLSNFGSRVGDVAYGFAIRIDRRRGGGRIVTVLPVTAVT